jgi:hypothetical protein
MDEGWVCVCGRANRAFSCPRCGKPRPAGAAAVPVTGTRGGTRQWFELPADEVPPPSSAPAVEEAPAPVAPAAPEPAPAEPVPAAPSDEAKEPVAEPPAPEPAEAPAPEPKKPQISAPSDIAALAAAVAGEAPSNEDLPAWMKAKTAIPEKPRPATGATPEPAPRPEPIALPPARRYEELLGPAPASGVIHTGAAPGLTLRQRIDRQLNEIASVRTRCLVGMILGLAIAFFATRVYMKHWSARQIIDLEIRRGPGDIRDTIPANIKRELGLEIAREDMQFLAITEAGMRDGALCVVTIRSDKTGFYEQAERIVRIGPNRPMILGFDFVQDRSTLWKIEPWREPTRLAIIIVGLALFTLSGVRLLTATSH